MLDVQAINFSLNKEAVRPIVHEIIGEALQKAASKAIDNESYSVLNDLDVIAQAFGFVVCHKCGNVTDDNYNFCGNCTAKLHEVCPHCWQKEGQPNNCPGDKCPARTLNDHCSQPQAD